MKLKEHIFMKGAFTGILKDREGNIVEEKRVENIVVQLPKNAVIGLFNGESATLDITHLAVGTGANTPTVNDTTLQAELARTTIVASTNVRVNASLTMEFFFPFNEANGAIKEIGVFLDGTATADSGMMFDRALFDVTKTNQNSLTVVFNVTAP